MGQLFEFLFNHWLLTSALMATLILLIVNEGKSRLLGITEIRSMEATQLINHQQAGILDVRDKEQFDLGHIVNAMHTPFALLEEQLEKYTDHKESPLIVYCSNGQQSARACALLNKSGFNQLYKLAGGLMTWNNANLPLTKD